MINTQLLEALLSQSESYHLDFKGCYWDNKACLVHDILCMANSLVNGDRFFVMGVENKTKNVTGVAEDQNRRNKQQITDTLKKARINNVPSLDLETIPYQNHEIDILVIHHGAARPYFITTEDYADSEKRVRAGVIYARDNDTNTPIDRCATPEQMTQLWLERFSLNMPPLKRLRSYLEDLHGWKRIINKSVYIIHYVPFPEFTISVNYDAPVVDDFKESWTQRFPDKSATSYMVDFKYHTTILTQTLFVSCDGGRYFAPVPDRQTINGGTEYFYNTKRMYMATWRLLEHIKGEAGIQNDGDIERFMGIAQISFKELA